MSVLVDTSPWSVALRRKNKANLPESLLLQKLINGGENIFTTGVIVQEILQGIEEKEQFYKLRLMLAYFSHLTPGTALHVYAVELFVPSSCPSIDDYRLFNCRFGYKKRLLFTYHRQRFQFYDKT